MQIEDVKPQIVCIVVVSIGSFIPQISTLLLHVEKDTLKAPARSAKHGCLSDERQTHRRAFAGHLSAILQHPLHPLPVWSLREYTSDTETNIIDSKETQNQHTGFGSGSRIFCHMDELPGHALQAFLQNNRQSSCGCAVKQKGWDFRADFVAARGRNGEERGGLIGTEHTKLS